MKRSMSYSFPLIRSQNKTLGISPRLPAKLASMSITLHSLACPVLFISIVSSIALRTQLRDPLPSPSEPSKASAVASATSLDLVALNASTSVKCESDWGRDLNIESCKNALEKIPRDSARLSFGYRGTGDPDVLLPARYLSGTSNYSCVIVSCL